MLDKYSKKTLSNGIRLILIPDDSKQVMTALALFGVGSRYEREEEAGISHVIEHMYFKGTKKRPTAQEISEFVESFGGEHNAFTSKEYTGYYVKAAAKFVDEAIDYLSDLVVNPLIRNEDLEREKGVIIQEMDMYEDLPMEIVSNKFELALFGKNSLGRDVIGYKSSVNGLNAEKLLEYRKKYYEGSNTILVLAGNFGGKTENEIVKLMEDSFSFSSNKTPAYPKVSLNLKKASIVISRKTEQSHLIVGFAGVPFANREKYALKMLALILGGSMSSRMFSEIREKRGLAYSVRSSVSTFHDIGSIETYAGVPHEKVEETIEAMLGEYRKAKKDISEAELEKAKQIMFGRMLISLEDSNDLANFYAMSELMTGEILAPGQVVEEYQKLEVADILEAANKYLNDDTLTLSYVGPTKLSMNYEL